MDLVVVQLDKANAISIRQKTAPPLNLAVCVPTNAAAGVKRGERGDGVVEGSDEELGGWDYLQHKLEEFGEFLQLM